MTDTKMILTFILASVFGAIVSAVLTYASPEMCYDRSPAAWIRQDCSIKINSALKEEAKECMGKK
jgi:hypothetical protein